jgi:preprotein translocase subunit YajC
MTLPFAPAMLVLFQPAGGNPVYASIFMYGAIFLIFWFILIRPQQKQRKDHEALIQNLKKGDEVVTAGGIIGRVIHIKETMKDGALVRTMDDRVTIESGKSQLIVERGRIARIVTAPTTTSTSA